VKDYFKIAKNAHSVKGITFLRMVAMVKTGLQWSQGLQGSNLRTIKTCETFATF